MDSSFTPTTGSASPIFSLVLRSETVAQAKVLSSNDGAQVITVPARVLRLGALTNLCESVTQIVCAATGSNIDDFEINAGLHLDSHKMCRALVSSSCQKNIDIRLAESAVMYYFVCIKNEVGNTFDLLNCPQDRLEDHTTQMVREYAADVLQKVGGSAISYPANVYLNGQQLAEFSGTFAPRPDVTNAQRVLKLRAQFDGYRHKVRTVYLLTEDGESVRANWSDESDFSKIIALANTDRKFLQLTLSVAQDQRGHPVYTLLL